MISKSVIQLLAVFVLTLSVTVLPTLVHADLLPSTGLTPATQWVPSGPASDKIAYTFYDSDTSELNAICAGQAAGCTPSIDLTDVPLPGADLVAGGCTTNCADTDPRFWVTTATQQLGMLQLDFNHAATMWGVTFCNGRDNVIAGVTQCFDGLGGTAITASCPNVPAPHTNDCTWAARNIRQGIAALINKVAFTLADVGAIGPNAAVMDNALTPASTVLHSGYPNDNTNPCANPSNPSAGFNTAGPYSITLGDAGSLSNSFPPAGCQNVAPGGTAVPIGGVCSWDAIIGCSVPAISAYHYFTDATDSSGFNLPAGTPAGNPGRDFCNAANHFIAAGLATGKNAACEPTGESSQLTNPSVPVIFKGRASLGRLQLSTGLTAAICELINLGSTSCPSSSFQLSVIGLGTAHQQVFRTGCTTLAAGPSCHTVGPNTPQNAGGSFTQSWNLYAGGFFFPTPTPDAQWALYDSSFASDYCGGAPGEEASNYDYICNPTHDLWVEQSQFLATPAAAEASLQVAMDIYGNHTFTVPMWTPSVQYPYVKGWTGVSNSAGIGTAQGNPWSLLNAWSANPTLAGPTIRWGQKDATASLNPYTFSSVVEADVFGEVYDSLLITNPASPTQIIGWMTNFYRLETHATQPAECPATYTNARGTFDVGACVKLILRGDIPWHDMISACATPTSTCLGSHVVTASDVKFSFASFNATGSLISPGTANTIDVVYNTNQLPASAYSQSGGANGGGISETLFLYLHSFSAWALNDIVGVPIIPQRLWVLQTAPVQSNGVFAPCTTLGSNASPNPSCTADPAFLGGVNSDPVATNRFIGSGPWVCANGDLTASGTVIGGGCTSSGTQSIPFFGSATLRRFSKGANGLDPNFAYFRTNAKFQQFQWAAYVPATNSVGNSASVADIISAVNACKASATAVGGVGNYQACAHWNTPSAGLGPCLGPAGTPCLGVAAGGHGSLPANPGPITTQIQQWIGRGAWTFGASSYSAVTGAAAIPQTLYDGGNSEGSFSIAASPTTVSTTTTTGADVTVSVSLSGGPDNNFTGSVPITLAAVSSTGVTVAFTGPTTLTLTPSAPTASSSIHITSSNPPGTYTVFVKASSTNFPSVTVKITVNQT